MIRPLVFSLGTLAVLSFVTAPARGAEVPYVVSIDGRPLDAVHPGARERGGRLYINVVRAVRAYDGLLTFAPGGITRVTVGTHTIIYSVGKTAVLQDDQPQTLTVAPFLEDGDTFVPLPSFASFVSANVTVDRDKHRVDLASRP